MKHEHLTMLRIQTELMGYLLGHQLHPVHSSLDIAVHPPGTLADQTDTSKGPTPPLGSVLTVTAPAAAPPTDLLSLRIGLATGRQTDIDDYQESLIGVHRGRDDFHLIGMSVDQASVTWAGGMVTITVFRKDLYS